LFKEAQEYVYARKGGTRSSSWLLSEVQLFASPSY